MINVQYDFPIIFKPLDDGAYSVQGYDITGCITFGETFEEAEFMADDALNLLLLTLEEEHREDLIPVPTPINEVKLNEGEIVKIIHADTEAYAKRTAEIEANPIKAAREAAKLTIKQLADLLEAPYRTVQNWDNGSRKAPKWLQKLVIEKIEASVAKEI